LLLRRRRVGRVRHRSGGRLDLRLDRGLLAALGRLRLGVGARLLDVVLSARAVTRSRPCTRGATATATATATAEPSGGTDLERAAQLQVQGFNARRAGDYEQALALSQQALDACGDTKQLSPCGYALFEVGAALNALGRPDEAIPYLEQRLEQYGDNSSGEVKAELKAAKKAAKG
jgi:tetratricopeptide (TPR) repeat protein